jgi:ABC-type antimicrobial peptide transport system permease subunit
LIAGRDFDDVVDTPSSIPVAIVNETTVREIMKGANPVGARITVEATPSKPERSFLIIGVVKDSKYLSLWEKIGPAVILASSQEPEPSLYQRVLLRSNLPAERVTAAVTRSLGELNPRIGVSYTLLTTQMADTLVRERLMASLSGFFGGLAALLTLVGLYGVIAYTVARRTNEIGVRMALGASGRRIVAMIVREAGMLVSLGLVAGLLLARAGGRAAGTLLFGLTPNDPLTLGAAVVGLAAVALVASYLPARAASRIEPTAALRVE